MAKAPQAEIDRLMQWLQARENTEDAPPPFMRVVFGYETLVTNCCDPEKDYLEFKPEMLADKARLDWIEQTHAWIHQGCMAPRYWGVVAPGKETAFGESFREAIDAARKT